MTTAYMPNPQPPIRDPNWLIPLVIIVNALGLLWLMLVNA